MGPQEGGIHLPGLEIFLSFVIFVEDKEMVGMKSEEIKDWKIMTYTFIALGLDNSYVLQCE